jgi:uncharacterized membrane protein
MLITGIYSLLIGLPMVFLPKLAFDSYGPGIVDASHIATLQYLGVDTLCFGLLAFLIRNAPNSVGLRAALLIIALAYLGSFLKGLYDIFILHPPMSGFLIGDTVFRLLLGLVVLYCYNREQKLAKAGV